MSRTLSYKFTGTCNVFIFQAWENEPLTTMVIIKGAGDKAFCAGGDIRGMNMFLKFNSILIQYTFLYLVTSLKLDQEGTVLKHNLLRNYEG